jgi:hypothetical protein
MRSQIAGRAVVLVAAIVAASASASAASAADQLALAPGSLPGLRSAHASPGAARADLAGGLPLGLAAEVRRATVQVSAQTGAGQLVRSDAFVLLSSTAAAKVLAAWRRAHHARRVTLGEDGAMFSRRGRSRSTVAVVAWRERLSVGVIVLDAGHHVGNPAGLALQYARLEDSNLLIGPPVSAWDKVADQVRPDGSVSEQTALEAFVLAYGPLPGVHPPAGPPARIPSDDVAGDWITPFLSRLPARQRRLVEQRLGITTSASGAHVSFCLLLCYGDPTFKPDAALQAIVDAYVNDYAPQLGQLKLTVVAGTSQQESSFLADAAPLLSSLGRQGHAPQVPAICRIRMLPGGQARDSADQHWILAHELFHCYEFSILGARVWHGLPKDWVTEGMATWAAFAIDPVPNYADGFIRQYIVQPHTPLFERSYDAVGFWDHLQDVDGALWSAIPGILNAGGNVAEFDASGANSTAFLEGWGSSVMRAVPGNDPNWNMILPFGPPVIPAFGALNPGGLGVLPGQGAVSAPAYGTSQYLIRSNPHEPIMNVAIDGSARLSYDKNYTDLSDAWFCTIAACACPPGTTGSIPPTRPLEPNSLLGLTGDPFSGTQGEIDSYPIDHFCHPHTSPPGGGGGGSMGCRSGACASSSGDPHLLTFAGDFYDFQAAGEFTLLKSTTDDLQIQERQQPFPRARDVAINTAVAMRVAGATVEVDAGRSTGSLVLWVNKRRVHAPSSLRLRGGGRLSANAAVTVSWPDGTQAQVFSGLTFAHGASASALDVVVKVAAGRAGHLTGLLGDAGSASGTEFVGRNRRRYSMDVARGDTLANFKLLYGSFGQSWRISQRDSLFVYPRGKDTNSYTITGFPSGPENVLSLSPGAFAAGEHSCTTAGVTNPAVLGGCILDVGATGDSGFAGGAAHLQGVTGGLPASAGGVSPIGWTELSSVPDTDTLLTPSLAPVGASIVAAFRAGGGTSIGAATFTPTAAGIGAVVRSAPFTGWSSISDPLLFRAPGGGLQMIFGGLNNSSALSGTLIAQRQPDGAFGSLSNTNSGPESNLARGAVLAADGITPIWTATYGPYLKLEAGASSPVETDLSSLVPGAAYVPTLAHDQSGRLWMAWYEIANNPAQSGLYLLQLAPSGDGVAPGASPQLAPESQTSDNLTAQPALACAAVCRLVYEDTGTTTQLDSWTPGQVRPTAIASDSQGFSDPTAAYTTDGRLWVTWAEPHSARLLAKLGDATGAGGSPILTLTPPGYSTVLNTASTVDGTQLVLATNWQTDSSTPNTAVFATVINAGR